jgi:hypothetical protein
MYEVCRVQKLDEKELAQFDDHFIDHLFEMVETTRDQQDERLNYAVIKLIASPLQPDGTLANGSDRIERTIHGISPPLSSSSVNCDRAAYAHIRPCSRSGCGPP